MGPLKSLRIMYGSLRIERKRGVFMPKPGITKRILGEAMKTLMTEKPLAKISVGDIVDYCGINRNSFYYHFKDKYDLVNWIFYTDFASEISQEEVFSGSAWDVLATLCSFLYKDNEFYINALSVQGQNSFAEYFTDMLRTVVETRTKDLFEKGEYQEFFANFFADTVLAAISRWLLNGAPVPPEKMIEMMKKTTTGIAAYVLEDSGANPE